MRRLLICTAAAVAQDHCASIPKQDLAPVATTDIILGKPTGFRTVHAVRWSHESARQAAARFCEKISDDKEAHERVARALKEGNPIAYRENRLVKNEECEERVAEELKPNLDVEDGVASFISAQYANGTQLALGAQLAVASAIRRSWVPTRRVLVFGAGRDSRMVCAAATTGAPRGRAVFVEDDGEWAALVRADLKAYLMAQNLPEDSCVVKDVTYNTHRAHWAEWLGRGPELAERVLGQINEQRQSFDVVVVDGPCGCNDLCPGRMAPLAAAVALAAPGTGVVFVDDYDRLVERVWANTMLRPNFDHEVLVQDTVLEHLKYFTHDARMECILPKAAAPPAAVEDYKGLENHFRPGGEEAKQLGFPTAEAFENATPEQAKAGLRVLADMIERPAWRSR
jgi:hypothetical protein